MEKFPEMTRYWFYLTFDAGSFSAIQRNYKANVVVVVKIQSILNMTKGVENTNINICSLIIFRRKKRRNVTIYRRYVIVGKVYDLSCTYNAYFFIYRNTERASGSFFTLLYIQFDKSNLNHLLNISTSCIDQCIKRYTI